MADRTKLALLPFVWTSCGVGCLEAPPKLLSDDQYTYALETSARVVGDEVHLYLVSVSTTRTLMATRRLSDGAVVGAVRNAPSTVDGICYAPGAAASAPHVFDIGLAGDNVVGYLTPSGQFAWSRFNVTRVSSLFENDLGWGIAFTDATVRTMFPPDSGTLTTIDRGSYQADSAVARKNLVISNIAPAGGNDAVLRAWEPDLPSRTLVAQEATDIPTVALSDTKLVWVGVHGPRRTDGRYTAAEMYWTAWPGGKTAVDITTGPSLPTLGGLVTLQTWGDYAAVQGANAAGDRQVIYVVRLSDGHLWTIKSRPGKAFQGVAVVSPTEILTSDVTAGDITLGVYIQSLLRFDLAHLDDLESAW